MSVLESKNIVENFQWFVIPHGRVPAAGGVTPKLRITIRVIPRLYMSSFLPVEPRRLGTLNVRRDPIGVMALTNWPRFFSEIESIGINFARLGSPRASSPPRLELKAGSEWAHALGGRGATIDLAGRIWASLFPRNLAVRPVDAPAMARGPGAQLPVLKRHPSIPHGIVTCPGIFGPADS